MLWIKKTQITHTFMLQGADLVVLGLRHVEAAKVTLQYLVAVGRLLDNDPGGQP